MQDDEHTAHETSCCAPARAAGGSTTATPQPAAKNDRARGRGPRRRPQAGTVALPGGSFLMGGDDPDANPGDGEGPVREVTVRPFRIDECAVTNQQFAAFVRDTGYATDAERFGWSYVFAGALPAPLRDKPLPAPPQAPWWRGVEEATWRAPEGAGTSIGDRQHHPVVHVSWHDAAAYAQWAGKRLPTEAEWEYAARGGLEQTRYPWGDELCPRGRWLCNIFQGAFPARNTAEDGYLGTAPAKAFRPNGFGLWGVVGNVWEWCADWFGTDHSPGPSDDPTGPGSGDERVMRGGSHLCHDSYCNRYRLAARTKNTPDSSSGNQGFRCALDVG